MRDNVVDAARLGSLFAALNDGGLPGFAPVDVGVSRSAATSGGAGGPRSPAVAAGVAESGERFGGSVEGLCVVLGEADSEGRVGRGARCEGFGRRRLCNVGAKWRLGCLQ